MVNIGAGEEEKRVKGRNEQIKAHHPTHSIFLHYPYSGRSAELTRETLLLTDWWRPISQSSTNDTPDSSTNQRTRKLVSNGRITGTIILLGSYSVHISGGADDRPRLLLRGTDPRYLFSFIIFFFPDPASLSRPLILFSNVVDRQLICRKGENVIPQPRLGKRDRLRACFSWKNRRLALSH